MPRRRVARPHAKRRAQKPPSRWLSRETHQPQSAFDRELSTKRRGEISELAFALAAARRGFAVSKPFGDCQRYDIILDPQSLNPHAEPTNNFYCARPRIVRVQVKSSTQLVNGLYRINSGRRLNGCVVPYRLSEIDFIAAYIIPEDSWFILPLPHILGQTSLLFRPKKSRIPGLYDTYREAWHYLTDPDGIEFA
jgi:PD-(D/E)XK endonuclease